MRDLIDFYNGKRILVTGHTGFKGSWLSIFLSEIGANVIGFALDPINPYDLFIKAKVSEVVTDIRGDIRNRKSLEEMIVHYKPEIVFHLAAQPLVIESYQNPIYTWEVNHNGTLNLLDILKDSDFVKSIIVITTDKVYRNSENLDGYKETDPLGGHDPYSASKASTEILVESFRDSFFLKKKIGIATARAGNVLGGGDWGNNRLIPDFYKSYSSNKDFVLRNPDSIRPWQHVLDVIYGYLLLGKKTYEDYSGFSSAWNFGPDTIKKATTQELVNMINETQRINIVINDVLNKEHETKTLLLNSDKSNKLLDWESTISLEKAISLLREYYTETENGHRDIVVNQIRNFINNKYK